MFSALYRNFSCIWKMLIVSLINETLPFVQTNTNVTYNAGALSSKICSIAILPKNNRSALFDAIIHVAFPSHKAAISRQIELNKISNAMLKLDLYHIVHYFPKFFDNILPTETQSITSRKWAHFALCIVVPYSPIKLQEFELLGKLYWKHWLSSDNDKRYDEYFLEMRIRYISK